MILNFADGYHYFLYLWQLEPSPADLELISLLLNATAPFFVDQDIIDEDPPTQPPTRYTPYGRKSTYAYPL